MVEKDYMEKMLQDLAELLRLIQANKSRPFENNITPALKARIAGLKELVSKFSELNKKALEKGGFKEVDLENLVKKPSPELSKKEKKLLDFSKKLKEEAEGIKLELSRNKEQKGSIYEKGEAQKTKDISDRKKKFKRLGGDHWLPL